MNAVLISGLCVVICAAIALGLASLAKRTLQEQVEKNQVSGAIFGFNVQLAGSIGAWISSFLIMIFVWVSIVYPVFRDAHQEFLVWDVSALVKYERDGELHNATEDVKIFQVPEHYHVVDGVLRMQITTASGIENNEDLPGFRFEHSACHEREIRHPHRHPEASIDSDAKSIHLGEIVLKELSQRSHIQAFGISSSSMNQSPC